MLWLLPLLLTTADAHRPSFGDTGMDDAETAYLIEDIGVSIVVYKELTCAQPQLWMEYDGLAGEELLVQLGVPNIGRLANHRPAVAVIGPGMPELTEEVPFDVPEGLGGYVFYAEDEPTDFDEPFTQTQSWIFAEHTLVLPEDGIGYVVGYNPDELTGKIWLATGVIEDFAGIPASEMASWGPIVREFHEVDEYERPLSYQEEVCAQPEETAPMDEGCGCQSAPTAPWLGLMPLPLLALRRRRTAARPKAPSSDA